MATSKKNGVATFDVSNETTPEFRIAVKGRDRWALECLIAAGEKGCTSVDNPAPRWSAYIFNLRRAGVLIETINEPHNGPFPGTHARYVLRSTVTPVTDKLEAA